MTSTCSLLASISLVLIAFTVCGQATNPTQVSGQKLESAVVDDSQPLSRFSGQQLLELLLEKYRRAMAEDVVYEPVYDDEDMYDSQRMKRYQRWGRGRIGGTIVMGKRK